MEISCSGHIIPFFSCKIHQNCIIIIICAILSGQNETLNSDSKLLWFNIIALSLKSTPDSGDLCHLLMTLVNSLNPAMFLNAVEESMSI